MVRVGVDIPVRAVTDLREKIPAKTLKFIINEKTIYILIGIHGFLVGAHSIR